VSQQTATLATKLGEKLQRKNPTSVTLSRPVLVTQVVRSASAAAPQPEGIRSSLEALEGRDTELTQTFRGPVAQARAAAGRTSMKRQTAHSQGSPRVSSSSRTETSRSISAP
jgi:hypothetical protein